MKDYINLKQIQKAEEQLCRQLKILKILYQQACQAEEKVKSLSYTEPAHQYFIKMKQYLEENVHIFEEMILAVKCIITQYRNTEIRITDLYTLDTVIYPETKFGKNIISGLDDYAHLLSF